VVGQPPSSKPATQTAAPVDPPEQPLDETFTFRNVFAPSITPVTATTNTEDGGISPADVPANTLVLVSVHSESGKRVATFIWNGAEYACNEGDQVDASPWKVLTIYSDSAAMLYGDSRVTLTVGQGFGDSGSVSK